MWWSDNSNNETGFIVEKRIGSYGPFNELTRTGPNEPWAFDEGPFQLYTYYYYRVRSYNAAGSSAPSNQVGFLWTSTCMSSSGAHAVIINVAMMSNGQTGTSAIGQHGDTQENGFSLLNALPSSNHLSQNTGLIPTDWLQRRRIGVIGACT
ncbi:MAG TPA: fibronectin type III domain-containing protein, partial [Blastocatellia bacterium]|nr:fibronectin type III domain-containing protein [Blastocatellia bacterium]